MYWRDLESSLGGTVELMEAGLQSGFNLLACLVEVLWGSSFPVKC